MPWTLREGGEEQKKWEEWSFWSTRLPQLIFWLSRYVKSWGMRREEKREVFLFLVSLYIDRVFDATAGSGHRRTFADKQKRETTSIHPRQLAPEADKTLFFSLSLSLSLSLSVSLCLSLSLSFISLCRSLSVSLSSLPPSFSLVSFRDANHLKTLEKTRFGFVGGSRFNPDPDVGLNETVEYFLGKLDLLSILYTPRKYLAVTIVNLNSIPPLPFWIRLELRRITLLKLSLSMGGGVGVMWVRARSTLRVWSLNVQHWVAPPGAGL